ncbi:hypothetical protein BK133_09055 [Paenibacillus sp. FSL H8-0548]|uniref:hypothetical protein n=1 Tax=Paenibacillus sp. FSL H8-0548 TaxID=1920422 RepID=UPI00096F8606|nr:hypothetical protein [Paenibacillus sp. FSL H8-0548]OMF36780.1 hypothetical protein BK133_09055 [Paenibacillus sp. FSL H8-0548]
MLRNRSFLIGLGTGIIIGALLFQLMLSGEQSRERLGLIGKETEETLYTSDEVESMLQAERALIQKEQEKQPVEETNSPIATPQAEVSQTAEPTEALQTEKPVIEHVIRIEVGSGLAKTAKLLANDRVIDDEAGFVKQMKKSAKVVRAGYFLFHENSTVEEVIAVVTGQPLTQAEAELIISNKK